MSTIVVVPGSQSIKIGLSTDPIPRLIIPTVLAVRLKGSLQLQSTLPNVAELSPTEREKVKSQIEQYLNKTVDKNTTYNEVPLYTEKNCLTLVTHDSYNAPDLSKNPAIIVGEDALKISKNEPYELIYPIQNGRLNTKKHSLPLVSSFLETILRHAIEVKLGIDVKQLKNYNVVLVVPDLFDLVDIRELLNVLLKRFQFSSALVHQESVCSTLAAGTPTACVVDIGHQRVNISCVDEGIVLLGSRFTMNLGGSNISKALLSLLKSSKRHYFPYPQCNLSYPPDEEIIDSLKESLCHLKKNISIQAYEFFVREPGQRTKLFSMNVSDALLIAPMGLFFPQLLEPIEPFKPNLHNTEDVFDADFLEQSKVNAFVAGKGRSETQEKENLENADPSKEDASHYLSQPLDEAIIKSITSVSIERTELRKKLMGNIVLVGGSSKIVGLSTLLQDRITEAFASKTEVDKVEVLSKVRNIDAQCLSWRGAAVLSNLEGIKECWIKSSEWEVMGIRALKERSLFFI